VVVSARIKAIGWALRMMTITVSFLRVLWMIVLKLEVVR
jgi:hypothetical protein